MLEKIIDFSAKNKFLIILLTFILVLLSLWCIKHIPLDAIPDLSDTQVIIYSKWDRSPDIIEDQVTYPIVTSLLGAPKVKAIRGFSDFGFSYVYVIFEEGTDIYWARSRVMEYLTKINSSLPDGVTTELGPDATGVGWVFQYALVDRSGKRDISELRALQDFNLRYQLQAIEGVAEVASIGGYQKQYQISINPNSLNTYNIPVTKVIDAVKNNNNDVGGRLIELAGTEYMVRGRGYAGSISDIENIVVDSRSEIPVLIKNIAVVSAGPQLRRGASDLNGGGEAVSGIIIMRHKENALNVINRVKAKLNELKPGLPEGVEVVPVYDRSDLIHRAINTLKSQLFEEIIIVSLIILLFLWHIPSSIVPIITIPVSSVLAFIPMYLMGINVNIMSLAGIAISIGVLVDGAIIEVENAYKRLELWQEAGGTGDPHIVRLNAIKEVIPAVFFSLLVVAVSFLPIFTLVDQEGKLFSPLAYTKTLTMVIAALLAVTFDPAVRLLFTRMKTFNFKQAWLTKLANRTLVGNYYPEELHPVSSLLHRIYLPACNYVLNNAKMIITGALLALAVTLPVYFFIGSEFMPPLNEGTILYMPTTLPGISIAEAKKILQTQDKILKTIPEVENVFGKAGRAETATDPAPLSMVETIIVLKKEELWREKNRWYSFMPEFFKAFLRPIWRDKITLEDLVNEMNEKMQFPGIVNAWTMPIKARIDMLSTGIRTPVGIKIFGPDLNEIEKIGLKLEEVLKEVPGTRSVFAERAASGYFLDIVFNRNQLARYGISIKDAQMTVTTAIGGEDITTTIEGRERYSVNIRYNKELRDDLESIRRILLSTSGNGQIPLAQVAKVSIEHGPSMIRDENGMLAGYVFADIKDRDIGGYVREAKKTVSMNLKTPVGYTLSWSGQYENMQRVADRLKIVIPLTLFLIFSLLYMNTKSTVKTFIILLAVPFSLIGAVWAVFLLGYNISIAVWVGMIALLGLDAETGVFMLLYLDLSYNESVMKNAMHTYEDLKKAVIHGAVKRIRPKTMTVMAILMGLIPIMWSLGAGSDVMKRIAAPMIGGVITSFILELLIYPPLYAIWKWNFEMKKGILNPYDLRKGDALKK